jgi:5-methylcytosine-specific restriction enzyme A
MSPDAEHLPHDWATRRLRVLRRYGYRCQHRAEQGPPCLAPASQCGTVGDPTDYSYDNLTALCLRHVEGVRHGR